ncbi:NERD domain-containing protein [Patulibacter brassicae]|uniref:NERD domain-containing protein n=1 Tax=Patulibacter brassicae TaxID=1705717 RepID=A0ABU4VK67_9ACTN|nr:NERD domain-containing protein [Patulibacter brassicae]MDX8152084.1 NERD domain-containing protein [Patulibacter brassicae]
MKMIPPVVVESTESNAERRLFRLLEKTELDRQAAALHSVDLPRHVYKRMGEIDFVVLSRAGVLVCEVKGGRVRRDADGMWHFTNRHGETNTKPEGPFKQGSSAMWSLHNDLRDKLNRTTFNEISFGYCVILPDIEWTADSVDTPADLVIDASYFAGASEIGEPLKQLLARWQRTNGIGDMSAETLDTVRNVLRASFDLVPSLGIRARGLSARLESLTEEQYSALDWVEDADRLLFAGGAGTGKTMLALEVARREAVRGARVLLTCQSPVLAAYLQTRAEGGTVVAALDDAEDVVEAEGRRFDVVVVDEAQDVFSLHGVSMLDAVVEGGYEQGRWRCFYDLNNQAGLFGTFEVEAFEMLREAAQTVPLRRNCRNTKPVVLQTQTVTAADLGTPMTGEGPAPTFARPSDVEDEATMLGAELRRLSEAGVAPGDITVLMGPAAPSPVELLERREGIRLHRLTAKNSGGWPPDRTVAVAIEDFKGFENDFVLVCGLDAIDGSQREKALVYVAMSRARIGLWLAVPPGQSQRFDDIRKQNLELVLAAREAAR